MITYTPAPSANWLRMTPMEVDIWNVLKDGPLGAPGIIARVRGDYFTIMNTIHQMARDGTLVPKEE